MAAIAFADAAKSVVSEFSKIAGLGDAIKGALAGLATVEHTIQDQMASSKTGTTVDVAKANTAKGNVETGKGAAIG